MANAIKKINHKDLFKFLIVFIIFIATMPSHGLNLYFDKASLPTQIQQMPVESQFAYSFVKRYCGNWSMAYSEITRNEMIDLFNLAYVFTSSATSSNPIERMLNPACGELKRRKNAYGLSQELELLLKAPGFYIAMNECFPEGESGSNTSTASEEYIRSFKMTAYRKALVLADTNAKLSDAAIASLAAIVSWRILLVTFKYTNPNLLIKALKNPESRVLMLKQIPLASRSQLASILSVAFSGMVGFQIYDEVKDALNAHTQKQQELDENENKIFQQIEQEKKSLEKLVLLRKNIFDFLHSDLIKLSNPSLASQNATSEQNLATNEQVKKLHAMYGQIVKIQKKHEAAIDSLRSQLPQRFFSEDNKLDTSSFGLCQ